MELSASLNAICALPRVDDGEFQEHDAIADLIQLHGWEAVRDAILNILIEVRPTADYQLAAEALWHGICDRRPVPDDRVIALLYYHLDPTGENEDNLVWSITSVLRGISYMSDYKPLADPRIQQQLAVIRQSQ